MNKGDNYFLGLVGSLLLVLIAAVVTFFAVGSSCAWMVGNGGTVIVLLIWTIVAVIDSRQHWPGHRWYERLGNIFSFQRY